MKVYEFVGNGLGVPGLPRTIKQSEGDRWIKEFEDALKKGKKVHGMPGAILKGALANGNFEAKSTIKEKSSLGKPPREKERE